MENLMFPMKNINITQRENGSYSHRGINAIDIAGAGTGKEWAIAPCDVKVVKVSNSNVWFQSVSRVKFADGSTNYAMIYCYHMENTGSLKVGRIIKRGSNMYQEGKYGRATGNHIHLQVAKGTSTSGVTTASGWSLKGAINTQKAFFIDSSYKIYSTGGNTYKKTDNNELKPNYVHWFISNNGKKYYYKYYGNAKVINDSWKHRYRKPKTIRYLMEMTRSTQIYRDSKLKIKDTAPLMKKGERIRSHNNVDELK